MSTPPGTAGGTARVEGTCEARYLPLREAFAHNLATLDEHGAAVAVWRDGRLVVDLWGGWRDEAATLPWTADTLVCMMSVVKGVTATLVHVLVDAGLLHLDRRVADYWPAFGAAGKSEIRVRHVLDHRAGIPALANPLPREAVFDWKTMTAAIAAEPALWPTGTVPAYHPVTMGFILGELIRRTTGLTPGGFLRQLMGPPGRFDYFIGVPRSVANPVAEIFGDPANTIFGATDRATLACTSVATLHVDTFNTPAFRQAEIPSINGHGTPRAVATLFGHLAECRAGSRSTPLSPAAIARATTEQWWAIEQTSMQERRMGMGLLLGGVQGVPIPTRAKAFGHGGAGGAVAFADPDLGLGFAYGTAHLHDRKGASPRTAALVDALAACA
jgi:CubicO group peptidase (beta-lactamase class C family)